MGRLILLLLAFSVISCATVVNGPRESLVIDSSPSGADAKLVCERESASGVTPTTLTIRRNAGDCVAEISKEGYETHSVTIEQGVNPLYWANLILAPLGPAGGYLILAGDSEEKALGIGFLLAAAGVFGTDFVTGAVHTHRPKRISAVLKAR